jgi:hypothetical protein
VPPDFSFCADKQSVKPIALFEYHKHASDAAFIHGVLSFIFMELNRHQSMSIFFDKDPDPDVFIPLMLLASTPNMHKKG